MTDRIPYAAVNRREFLLGAAAVAAAARPVFASKGVTTDPTLPASREDFPWAATETYLNAAAYHPISRASAQAMERYIAYRLNGPGPDRGDFDGDQQQEVKAMFGRLINAEASEIAFVQSTSDGENIVIAGMDLLHVGGNVVIDELHYNSSLYIYKTLEKAGLEVRLVPQRDGVIDVRDMEAAIDRQTKLVSMALVSNVNGFMHDVKRVSEIAHAHGAYVYADVIQAAGAVPMDVKAMGLDMCACSAYKWLMGDRGFGFLYIAEALQGDVVKPTRFGHRQYSSFDRETISWTQRSGGYLYETGNISNVGAACMHEALTYILAVGVDTIRDHVRPLTDRLQRELPGMGYAAMTPAGTDTPVVTFRLPDMAATRARLARANIAVTTIDGPPRMRVSPSVYNTRRDVDRLIAALA